MRSRFAASTLSFALVACGGAPEKAPQSAPADEVRVAQGNPPSEPLPPEPSAELPTLEIIQPGEVVPAFQLTAEDGTKLDSQELVGKKPFMMVFFASWCKVCELKLPVVKKAVDDTGGDILIIGVALDNDDTWERVASYVERHGIGDFKLVRGQENRAFAVAYNPFNSVPVVEVIDRSGVIAELQRGHKGSHEQSLIAALEHVHAPVSATP